MGLSGHKGAVVGKTEAEAKRQHAFLQSKIHPDVGLEVLSAEMNQIDLTGLDVDKPLPEERIPKADTTARKRTLGLLQGNTVTIRQLYELFSGARSSHLIVGDPVQVADRLQDWFENRGGDGFIVQPSYLPGGLDDFVELVVPELQRRGIFRTEYEGKTMRENLGLARPQSRYATRSSDSNSS
jgi:alkanesulfonate monooxygenase SsuD/methylene tetrahydromethanopterin reductase-like flavin-dependent oxidoreductase (luciferase family)